MSPDSFPTRDLDWIGEISFFYFFSMLADKFTGSDACRLCHSMLQIRGFASAPSPVTIQCSQCISIHILQGVVPFDITVLSILFILMMTLLCHEIYAAFRKPLLANHEEVQSGPSGIHFALNGMSGICEFWRPAADHVNPAPPTNTSEILQFKKCLYRP